MHNLESIVARAKRRGFVYPGSDIYGGLANARDYGPYGVQLKKNIADLRWKTFVQERKDMVGLDAQILMHPRVRETSGHVGGFNDPLIDCKRCKTRMRADKLIDALIFHHLTNEKWWALRAQEIGKESLSTKERESIILQILHARGIQVNNLIADSRPLEQQEQFIKTYHIEDWLKDGNIKHKVIVCPNCGATDWSEVRTFSLMFSTHQGVIQDDANKIWLRPETAQGMFVNFKNIIDTMRVRLPFGIGQIGKAFRNEITPGNFLYRTREFEQMEIEYFVAPEEEVAFESIEKWKNDSRHRWTEVVKISTENLRRRTHEADELSHYSRGTWDVEFLYPWGWGELQGLAYRTDFDLKAHQTASGKDFQYHDPISGKRFVPHVIEPSFGLSRMVLAIMLNCYAEETYTDGQGNEQTRTVVRFPKEIAPVRCAIIPLIKKDQGMLDLASQLYTQLSQHVPCEYDDSWNIGKCYRRQDEIGTPFCITIDHQSLEDGTVTLRQRDDMSQQRISRELLLTAII